MRWSTRRFFLLRPTEQKKSCMEEKQAIEEKLERIQDLGALPKLQLPSKLLQFLRSLS